jgi:hypothetical protein
VTEADPLVAVVVRCLEVGLTRDEIHALARGNLRT